MSSPDSGAPAGGFTARASAYVEAVLSGAVPSCRFVKQACLRQRNDRERFANHPLYVWDEPAAERVCRFVELLPHVKGPKANANELISLEDWQCFVLTTLFGWKRRDTGGRRFKRAYTEVPRGNAKSTLSAAVALYGLTSDGEMGAEVYAAATTKEQACIVWKMAKTMLQKRATFSRKLGIVANKAALLQPDTNSFFIPLSRDAKGHDGANVHLAIVDELHAHRTRDLYDTLETGTGKRLSSLLWVITTAGGDTAGICFEVRSYVAAVLDGNATDESQFGCIWTLDEGDDWLDPLSWVKANPNWDVSVIPDVFASLADKARQLPSAQGNFKTKHLNIWTNADQQWMDMEAWDRCGEDITREDFAADECFIGLDLASKVDIAAKAYLFRRMLPKPVKANASITERIDQVGDEPELEAHYYFFLDSYLPEAAVADGRNSQYPGWELVGRLKLTPGDVLDFDQVEQELKVDRSAFHVREVGYDPWQATQLAQRLTEEQVPMVEVRATTQNFSAPMKEIDALVRSGRFHHDRNPVARWMVSNVVCHTDANENVYPRKERADQKIDGVVAAIIALNRALFAEPEAPSSPYETRGIRFL